MDIYLVSDSLNLSGQVHGYFVRIGSTQDEVSLYKPSGDKSTITKIIDGMDDRVDLSTVALNIKVTKSHENTWELFVDPSLDQTFVSEGICMDGEHFFSNFFGVKCTYTSTRSDKFFFDNISITGNAFSDMEAPEVDSLFVMSDSTISVIFNEPIPESSWNNLNYYFVDNGIGNPRKVDAPNDSTLVLHFQEMFQNGFENQISIHGIKDYFGNPQSPFRSIQP